MRRLALLITLIFMAITFTSCGTATTYRQPRRTHNSQNTLSKTFNRANNIALKDRHKVTRLFRDLSRATRDREVKRITKTLKRYTR